MCVGCGKGRVVKQKRTPRTNPQRILGASGISLIEFVGEYEPDVPFTVTDESGNKTSYDFSNTESKRSLFVDKQHAEKLLAMTNARGEKLFVELATWGPRISGPPSVPIMDKLRDFVNADEGNLPDGFASV